ncbi:MAG: IS66 family transposase [Hyphomicrobiaceae bacterium]
MSDAAHSPPELPDDIGTLKSMIGAYELRIAVLEEKLRLAQHKRFGASSEKADPDQLGLFNEAESLAGAQPAEEPAALADDAITIPAHTRAKGGRKPFPQDLPRERVEHDFAEIDKMCPCGSGHMRPRIGEVVTEQCDIEPAKIKIIQNVRFKYGSCHVCDGVFPDVSETSAAPAPNAGVVPTSAASAPSPVVVRTIPRTIIVAPLPLQPIPKSIATAGLCAFIAIMKYADGLPLYRQEKILARYGIDISRATLASWMIKLGELIVPLMNLLHETQVSYDVLQMDETTVQVLKEDGRAAQTKSRMWVRRGGSPKTPVILFDYEPTRSGAVAWRLLEDFKGILQSDGYSGYTAVGKRDGIVHVGCLAHARRKFDEALKAQKATGRGGLAAEGLALIQRIYATEKAAREAKLTPDQRKKLRDERARPVWDELRKWLDAKRGHAPPQTLVGQAMTFLDNQWPLLIRMLDDGRIEVDNNLCENAIRPFVMGRKAWLFSDTPAGAQASARLYSLIETAKASGLEPYAYLKRVFSELPRAITLADVEALMPWNVRQPATQSVAA